MAIVDCPSCHKAINVPAHKLGRWIACPVCNMEFAALGDEPEPEANLVSPDSDLAELPASPKSRARILAPIGLLLMVFLVGGVVFAVAKKTAGSGGSGHERVSTTSREAMPPVKQGVKPDGGLDLSALQGGGGLDSVLGQGGGGLDSILGIGSTIKSFIWWTTVLSIVFLVSSIGMLVWLARDSRNRGLESVASWITPILLTNIVAFLVYLMSRPQGKLVNCRHCNNRCLENAGVCPHCRRKKPVRKARAQVED